MNDKQAAAVRKAMDILRQAKAGLDALYTEIDNEQTLLPERLWRTPIDDDFSETAEAVGNATMEIDSMVWTLAETIGEEELIKVPQYAKLPPTLPTYAEVDAKRRIKAQALRDQR